MNGKLNYCNSKFMLNKCARFLSFARWALQLIVFFHIVKSKRKLSLFYCPFLLSNQTNAFTFALHLVCFFVWSIRFNVSQAQSLSTSFKWQKWLEDRQQKKSQQIKDTLVINFKTKKHFFVVVLPPTSIHTPALNATKQITWTILAIVFNFLTTHRISFDASSSAFYSMATVCRHFNDNK